MTTAMANHIEALEAKCALLAASLKKANAEIARLNDQCLALHRELNGPARDAVISACAERDSLKFSLETIECMRFFDDGGNASRAVAIEALVKLTGEGRRMKP